MTARTDLVELPGLDLMIEDRRPLVHEALQAVVALSSSDNPSLGALEALGALGVRADKPAHLTCSVVTTSRHPKRVLALRRDGLLLQPGGHVRPDDRTLRRAASRELQ